MKSPKFKIYGIKRIPKRIKVLRKEIQGNQRQFREKSTIKFSSLNYLKQELAEDLNKSFSILPTQDFDELNETVSSLSLNESKDSEMVENLNQNVAVENQETKGFENVTIQSASTSGSHESQINMDSTKIGQLQSILPGQKQAT